MYVSYTIMSRAACSNSWANEEEIIDEKIFPRRSQYARMQCLGEPAPWDGMQGYIHLVGWKSGLINKLCRSTFRAESQGCCYAMEAADRFLAAQML